MRAAIFLLFALAPAWAAAAPPPVPPPPPEAPAPAKAPAPPNRVLVIKSGPGGHTWTVPTRERAFLGVQLLELTDELRGHFGVKDGVGVMIAKVEKDTPAATAGLQVGDVLVAVDGAPIGSAVGLVRAIRAKKDGDRVSLEVIRKGKKRTLEAKLTVRETPQIDLSGLFQLSPDRRELRLEVDGENIGIPLPPMPQIQDLREHILKLRESGELLEQLEKEKVLEKRLRELEDKLQELEKKLQGKTSKASRERDARVSKATRRIARS